MLLFENVVKKFVLDEKSIITPVNDISFQVGAGEMVMVMGRSGSGKTTLLNLAAGLVKPSSGKVLFQGQDLMSLSDAEVSHVRAKQMGFVFQFPSLIPTLNVLENVCLPNIFLDKQEQKTTTEKAASILEKLGLAAKRESYPRQLSAGEQKRTVIARALINQPNFILADEPTSDLDSATENEVMDILREIHASGVAFLIVTHNRQLKQFADRSYEMRNGVLSEIN